MSVMELADLTTGAELIPTNASRDTFPVFVVVAPDADVVIEGCRKSAPSKSLVVVVEAIDTDAAGFDDVFAAMVAIEIGDSFIGLFIGAIFIGLMESKTKDRSDPACTDGRLAAAPDTIFTGVVAAAALDGELKAAKGSAMVLEVLAAMVGAENTEARSLRPVTDPLCCGANDVVDPNADKVDTDDVDAEEEEDDGDMAPAVSGINST